MMRQPATTTNASAAHPSSPSLLASVGRTSLFLARLVVLTIVFLVLKAFFSLFRR
jgi:hypothetical protein